MGLILNHERGGGVRITGPDILIELIVKDYSGLQGNRVRVEVTKGDSTKEYMLSRGERDITLEGVIRVGLTPQHFSGPGAELYYRVPREYHIITIPNP